MSKERLRRIERLEARRPKGRARTDAFPRAMAIWAAFGPASALGGPRGWFKTAKKDSTDNQTPVSR
jgi:hypothetical protein